MLLGITSVTHAASAPAKRNVENQRSKTPSPNSARKADEIWVQRPSRSVWGPELFTGTDGVVFAAVAAERTERPATALEARRLGRGEIERGIFYSVKSGPESFRACRIRGETRRIATGRDARFGATPGAGGREPWNSYSQVVHRLPVFLSASQALSVSAGKIALKNFGGVCKLFVKIA
jgi:hypothetical protein